MQRDHSLLSFHFHPKSSLYSNEPSGDEKIDYVFPMLVFIYSVFFIKISYIAPSLSNKMNGGRRLQNFQQNSSRVIKIHHFTLTFLCDR